MQGDFKSHQTVPSEATLSWWAMAVTYRKLFHWSQVSEDHFRVKNHSGLW